MRIVQVEYLSGYKLKLTFANQETKIVDLAEKVKNAKGIFLPLKDLEYFKKVAVDDCEVSIFWPNGADICPDVLYQMGSSVPKKRARKKLAIAKRYGKQTPRQSKTRAHREKLKA